MTDTTGTAELVKRLRGPVRQAAQDLIDAAFNNREGRGVQFSIPAKPDEDTDLVLAKGIKDAADALEAAERVIAPFAEAADDYDGRRMNRTRFPDYYPVVGNGVTVGRLRAARDWLARHATGQKGGDDAPQRHYYSGDIREVPDDQQ